TGRGNGFFNVPSSYLVGQAPQALALTDFDGDGSADILTPDSSGHGFLVLFGKLDGTFDAPPLYPVGLAPRAVAVGDFNGDGEAVPDIATANGNRESTTNFGNISILLGNGDGTFQPPVNYAAGVRPYAIAVGDFNADGKLDLAVGASGDIPSKQPEAVAILLG